MNLKSKILNKKIIIVTVFGVMVFALGIMVGAQTTEEAGSVNDPLISKSYLDMRLSELDGSGGGTSYEKVTLTKGQVLVGVEGCEFIIYKGNAAAYSTLDGIINVTVGEMVENGITLGKYCVYVCPDSESGLKATSDLTIFIKGKYSTNLPK